jgi:hypothetical protein
MCWLRTVSGCPFLYAVVRRCRWRLLSGELRPGASGSAIPGPRTMDMLSALRSRSKMGKRFSG